MSKEPRVPSYRRHKQSGQAVVTLTGQGGSAGVVTSCSGSTALGRAGPDLPRHCRVGSQRPTPAPNRGQRRRSDRKRTRSPILAARRTALPAPRRHPDRRAERLPALPSPPQALLRQHPCSQFRSARPEGDPPAAGGRIRKNTRSTDPSNASAVASSISGSAAFAACSAGRSKTNWCRPLSCTGSRRSAVSSAAGRRPARRSP